MEVNTKLSRKTYTAREIGELMGISLPSAYDLCNSEGFPSIRIGKKIVVPCEAFERWLNETAAAPKQGR